MLHRGLERQASGSEALQQQPSAYLGTPPPPTNVLERIPEDSATHDAALSPQDLFPGKSLLCVPHEEGQAISSGPVHATFHLAQLCQGVYGRAENDPQACKVVTRTRHNLFNRQESLWCPLPAGRR